MPIESDTTPHFPPELEREIFETTAQLYSKAIPTLLRVARRVLEWIEPILYNTVSIEPLHDKRPHDIALLRALNTKPADFFLHAVQQLHLLTFLWAFMGYRPVTPWSNTELEKALRVCKGATTLILVGPLDKPAVLPMLSDMRPKRLYLGIDLADPRLDFSTSLFQSITHLLLYDLNRDDGSIQNGWSQLQNLFSLPSLTHLALDRRTAVETLRAVLSGGPNLQTIILFGISEPESTTAPLPFHDERVVMFLDDELIHQWNSTDSEGNDIWARADRFILRKQRGEIEESCYHLEALTLPKLKPDVQDVQSQSDPTESIPGSESVPTVQPVESPSSPSESHPRIEPFLYTRIRITAHSQNDDSDVALLRAAQSKPADFLGVRRVELNFAGEKAFPWESQESAQMSSPDSHSWSDAELSSVLQPCTGVVDLALIGNLSDSRLLSLVSHMRPTRLTLAADLDVRFLTPTYLNHPFLHNITHLLLFDADVNLFDADSSVPAKWSSCWAQIITSGLPSLTHLALFPCQMPNDSLSTMLSDLPDLQTLILLTDLFADGRWLSQHLPVSDPRVVVVKMMSEWRVLFAGSGDEGRLWDGADIFQAQKRAGRVEASCYYLELGAA